MVSLFHQLIYSSKVQLKNIFIQKQEQHVISATILSFQQFEPHWPLGSSIITHLCTQTLFKTTQVSNDTEYASVSHR